MSVTVSIVLCGGWLNSEYEIANHTQYQDRVIVRIWVKIPQWVASPNGAQQLKIVEGFSIGLIAGPTKCTVSRIQKPSNVDSRRTISI